MTEVDRAVSRAFLAGAIASFAVAILVAVPHYVFPGTLALAMVGPTVPWLGVIGFTLFVAWEVHRAVCRRSSRRVGNGPFPSTYRSGAVASASDLERRYPS